MSDNWLDSALAQSGEPIDVDVLDLGIKHGAGLLEQIQVLPLSAAEYQVLKSHPDIRNLKNGEDRTEMLGLLVTFEMMSKCDVTLNWTTFKQLPLTLLNDLSTAILTATRGEGGEGDEDPLGL